MGHITAHGLLFEASQAAIKAMGHMGGSSGSYWRRKAHSRTQASGDADFLGR
jgi:hypothetical protein